MLDSVPGPDLLRDKDVAPLAGGAGMPGAAVTLAAARALPVGQAPLRDHPKVAGQTCVRHPQLPVVLHCEDVHPRAGGTLPVVVHSQPVPQGRSRSKRSIRSSSGMNPAVIMGQSVATA